MIISQNGKLAVYKDWKHKKTKFVKDDVLESIH